MSEHHVQLESEAMPKLAWLSAPASDAEGGGEEQAYQGDEEHPASLPCSPGPRNGLGRATLR